MKLYLPGLAEYSRCKAQFKLVEQLLEDADKNRTELSGILKTLVDNPDAVRFLEAEFQESYQQVYERLVKISAPVLRVTTGGDYLKLENIVCLDADGREFERYPELYINSKVEKSADGNIAMFTPYNAIHHLEQQGDFLPSAALLANIQVALYHAAVEKRADGSYKTKDTNLVKVLQKFKNRGDGTGGQWANTLIDWGNQQVIHYPDDSDFPSHGGTSNINASRSRVALGFDKTSLSDGTVENGLALPNYRCYLQNYSGLADPAVLIELAQYYGETAMSWVGSASKISAAWLGCGSNRFGLIASSYLDGRDAARGVCLVAPAGRAP